MLEEAYFFPLIPALSGRSGVQASAFAELCHWRSYECTANSMLRSKWTPPGTCSLVTASADAAPKGASAARRWHRNVQPGLALGALLDRGHDG